MKSLTHICLLLLVAAQTNVGYAYENNMSDLSRPPGECTASQKTCSFHNHSLCCDSVAECGSNGVGPTCVFQKERKISSFANHCSGAKLAIGCPDDTRCGLDTDLAPICVKEKCSNGYACSASQGSVCCHEGEECREGANGTARCAAPQKRCAAEERLCYGSSGENCCPKSVDCTADGMCLASAIPVCSSEKRLCPEDANLSEPFLCCGANEFCENLKSAGAYTCSRTPHTRGIRGIAHSISNPDAPVQGEIH